MDILDIDETLDIDDLTNEYEAMLICKTPPVRPVMFGLSQLLTPDPVYEVLALTSPWTVDTGSFGAAMDREGRVQFLGTIKGGTSGSTVITLPLLYRPPQRIRMVIATEDGLFGWVYIRTTGVVQIYYSGTGWCALDNVSYHTRYLWHSEG